MTDTTPPCPRCRSVDTAVLAESPQPGIWTMFSCDICYYTWRSTEPDQNTDPAQYPAVFRLDPTQIPQLPTIPPKP